MKMELVRRSTAVAIGLGCALSMTATCASAEAKKSWKLSSNNWQQAEGLLPEVILERVKNGDYWFNVLELEEGKLKGNYSKSFWAASEANDGKFDIDPEVCGLLEKSTGKIPDNWFGYPFPNIDKEDPLAACKMAWNFQSANSMGEGQGATFTLNGVNTGGEFKRIKLYIHANNYIGRHKAIDNPEGLRSAAITNVMEPQDVDGVGGLTKRKNDSRSQDQSWFYVPATRRVRRVNAATRSDPVAGLDIFGDDVNCYAGKVEYYKWKLIGETTVLAGVLSPDSLPQRNDPDSDTRYLVDIPYFRAAYETPGAEGVPWLVVENLSMIPREAWIIEGQSEDPYYNFGKVVMYMDKELYRIWWKLVHNRAGEYFYNAMCAYHFSKHPTEDFTAVTPNMVIGVNDKTNRAALGGRYSSQFIEREFPDDYFTLRHLTHISD